MRNKENLRRIFNSYIEASGVDKLTLILDNKTRQNSTARIIKTILKLRSPLTLLLNSKNDYSKELDKYYLTNTDFSNLQILYNIIDIFTEPTTFL